MTPGFKRTDVDRLLALSHSEQVHDGAVLDRDVRPRAGLRDRLGAGGAAIATSWFASAIPSCCSRRALT
jgi:hypothetical protein